MHMLLPGCSMRDSWIAGYDPRWPRVPSDNTLIQSLPDPTYCTLKGLSWLRLVRDLRGQLAAMHLPQLPSIEAIRARVQRMYAHAPATSLDDIAERARQLLVLAVSVQLFDDPESLRAT